MPNIIKSFSDLIEIGHVPITNLQVANTSVANPISALVNIPLTKVSNSFKEYGFQPFLTSLSIVERLLIDANFNRNARINTLRGIYYGTEWSVDYFVEKSKVRNVAFQVYTGTYTPPLDPRPIIGEEFYTILFNGAELRQGKNKFDFGHFIIALDARNSFRGREIPIPTQGGTGLEITTWLGDLGGACGMLSIRRVSNPRIRAITMFRGSSFGGQVNLEGDIGGFLVGRNEEVNPSGVLIGENDTIADVLSIYLPLNDKNISAEWLNRSYNFIKILGAEFDIEKNLLNREEVEENIAQKIQKFGEWYMVNRLRQKGMGSIDILISASAHLVGTSKEITSIFIDTLLENIKNPTQPIKASGNGPNPTIKGQPFQKYIVLKESQNWIEKASELFENLW